MAQLRPFAKEFGVTIELPDKIPYTKRALAITEFARDMGKLELFRDATMEAHWSQGKDIEAIEDLAEIASAVGLEPDEALSAGDDPAYLARVDDIRKDAQSHQVTAIPTFMFGQHPVVGCQRYETLERIAQKLQIPEALSNRPSK